MVFYTNHNYTNHILRNVRIQLYCIAVFWVMKYTIIVITGEENLSWSPLQGHTIIRLNYYN